MPFDPVIAGAREHIAGRCLYVFTVDAWTYMPVINLSFIRNRD